MLLSCTLTPSAWGLLSALEHVRLSPAAKVALESTCRLLCSRSVAAPAGDEHFLGEPPPDATDSHAAPPTSPCTAYSSGPRQQHDSPRAPQAEPSRSGDLHHDIVSCAEDDDPTHLSPAALQAAVQQLCTPQRLSDLPFESLTTLASALSFLLRSRSLPPAVARSALAAISKAATPTATAPLHDLAPLSLALVRAGVPPSRLLLHISSLPPSRLTPATTSPTTISQTLQALALAGPSGPTSFQRAPLCDALLAAALTHRHSFHPQAISASIWALAKLGHAVSPSPLLRSLGATSPTHLLHLLLQPSIDARLSDFTGKDICNLLWASTRSGAPLPAPQLQALLGALLQQAEALPLQSLASCLWSLAKVKPVNPPTRAKQASGAISPPAGATAADQLRQTTQSIFNAAVRRLATARHNSLDVANVAWACAELELRATVEHWGVLRAVMRPLVPKAKLRDVLLVLWAHAKRGAFCPAPFVHAVAARVERELRGAGGAGVPPRDVAMLAWALASLRHQVPGLFAALLAGGARRWDAADSRSIAATIWAVAVLEPREHGEWLRGMEGALLQRLPTLGTQALANACWACAVVHGGRVDGALALALLQAAARHEGRLTVAERRQVFALLFVAAEEVRREGGEGGDVGLWRLEKVCRGAFEHKPGGMRDVVSRLQAQVHRAAVEGLEGWQARLGFKTAGNLFVVDVALLGGPRRVALEVNGPLHYTSTEPYRELGDSLLRRRMLELGGWRVAAVPFYEWNALEGEGQRVEYLRQKVVGAAGLGAGEEEAAAGSGGAE